MKNSKVIGIIESKAKGDGINRGFISIGNCYDIYYCKNAFLHAFLLSNNRFLWDCRIATISLVSKK